MNNDKPANAKQNNTNTIELESKIDQMVYDFYDLIANESEIIEGKK